MSSNGADNEIDTKTKYSYLIDHFLRIEKSLQEHGFPYSLNQILSMILFLIYFGSILKSRGALNMFVLAFRKPHLVQQSRSYEQDSPK